MHATIRTKIFSAIFAVSLIFVVIAVIVMNVFLGRLAKDEVDKSLRSGRLAYERFEDLRYELLTSQARSISQTPYLRAVMSIPEVDHETVYYTAKDIYEVAGVSLVVLLDAHGNVLADANDSSYFGYDARAFPGVAEALDGVEQNGMGWWRGSLYRIAMTPLLMKDQLLGLLILGNRIDAAAAGEIRGFTGRDVLIVHSGKLVSQSVRNPGLVPLEEHEVASFLHQLEKAKASNPDALSPFPAVLGRREFLAVAVPFEKGEGQAILFRALDEVDSGVAVLRISVLGAGAVSILFAVTLSLWLSARVSRPVLSLRDAVEEFGTGKLEKQVTVQSKDELGQLSNAFNRMAQDILSAQRELKGERDKIDNILRSMIDMLIVADPEGIIRAANPSTMNSLGYAESELLGQHIDIVFGAKDEHEKKQMLDALQMALTEKRSIRNLEGTFLSKNGRSIAVLFSCSTLLKDQGEIEGVVCVAQDITERKEAEEQLSKLSVAVEQSPSVVIITDTRGAIEYVNPKFEMVTGYSAEEVIGKNPRILKSGTQPQKFYEELWQTIESGREWHGEFCNVKKDGETYWVSASISPIHNEKGEITHFLAVQEDITERKQTEEEIANSRRQLQELSSHLQRLQEEERSRISREVHDEFGQSLTAMKMDLTWLKSQIPGEHEQILNNIIDLADSTISSVRRISTQLRPGILDDLGLTAAIEWQVQEFQNRSGIECQLVIGSEEISVERDRATSVFRILQEALTNVMRHSEASKVSVSVELKDGVLEMTVTDNGKGITDEQISNRKSLGLLGMKERLLPWGGKFHIGRVDSSGTMLSVSLPVKGQTITNGG